MIKTIEATTHDFGGDIFIDVGANQGLWTIELLDLYNKIYYIEPSISALSRGRDLINGHCVYWGRPELQYRVEYLRRICALSSGSLASITSPTGSSANFSQYSRDLYGSDLVQLEERDIPTMCIDDLVPFIPNHSKITVKIDTEGADLDILWGARLLNAKFKPVLCIEFHFHMRRDLELEHRVRQMLSDLGYQCQVNRYRCYLENPDHVFDHVHTGRQMQDLHYQTLWLPPDCPPVSLIAPQYSEYTHDTKYIS